MRLLLLLTGLVVTGCSPIQTMRTDLSAAPSYNRRDIENQLIKQLASSSENGKYKDNPSDADVEKFIDAGMTLSDYYCDIFFRRTNQAARHRQFARSATNDVGGLVASALGFAQARPEVVGGVAAGFTFLDRGYRNYDESFLVDADLATLRRMVNASQDSMRSRLFASPPKSYFSAESAIIRYAGLCSFLGMKNLVNESVRDKAERIEDETRSGGGQDASATDSSLPAPSDEQNDAPATTNARSEAPPPPPVR